MEFQFVFKQMESSDSVKEYVKKKLSNRLTRLVTKPLSAQFTFCIDKHQHLASCVLSGGDRMNIQADYEDKDLYVAIDKVIDRIIIQVKKHKSKIKDYKIDNNLRKKKDTTSVLMNNTSDNPNIESNVEGKDIVDAEYIIKYEKVHRK